MEMFLSNALWHWWLFQTVAKTMKKALLNN